MPNRFTRVATSCTVVAAVAAGALFMAPAANAATVHHITSGYSSQSETVKVGTHKDKLALKKASSKVTLISKATKDDSAVYAPSYYTLTLTNAKGHKLFTKKVSSWRGLNAFLESESHTYKTDASLTKQVKHDVTVSTAAAKKSYNSVSEKLGVEFGEIFTLGFLSYGVETWVKANPTETTFDAFYAESKPSDAAAFKKLITGTPQDFTLATKDSKTGIGLAIHVVAGASVAAGSGWTGPAIYGTFNQGGTTISINKK